MKKEKIMMDELRAAAQDRQKLAKDFQRDPKDPLDFLYDNEVHIDTDVEPIHKDIEKHFTRRYMATKIRGLRKQLKELQSA